jgi:hypothetical protein
MFGLPRLKQTVCQLPATEFLANSMKFFQPGLKKWQGAAGFSIRNK